MRNLPAHYHNNSLSQYQDNDYLILPESDETSEKSIFDYLKIIKRRKLLFISPTIIILPLIIFYIISQRPVYEAKATLLINQESDNILPIQGMVADNATNEDYLNTQYEIIKSRPIAETVVKKLKLHEKPPPEETAFEKRYRQGKEAISSSIHMLLALLPSSSHQDMTTEQNQPLPTSDESLELAIINLQESINVVPRPKTQLVDIFHHRTHFFC